MSDQDIADVIAAVTKVSADLIRDRKRSLADSK